MTDRDPFERELAQGEPITADSTEWEPTDGEEDPKLHRFITPFAVSRHPDEEPTETAVWYHDDHDRADVLRAWLDANPRLRDSTADHIESRLDAHDELFLRVFRNVVRAEYDLPSTYDVVAERREKYENDAAGTCGDCPACGESLAFGESYREHLLECPEWGGA